MSCAAARIEPKERVRSSTPSRRASARRSERHARRQDPDRTSMPTGRSRPGHRRSEPNGMPRAPPQRHRQAQGDHEQEVPAWRAELLAKQLRCRQRLRGMSRRSWDHGALEATQQLALDQSVIGTSEDDEEDDQRLEANPPRLARKTSANQPAHLVVMRADLDAEPVGSSGAAQGRPAGRRAGRHAGADDGRRHRAPSPTRRWPSRRHARRRRAPSRPRWPARTSARARLDLGRGRIRRNVPGAERHRPSPDRRRQRRPAPDAVAAASRSCQRTPARRSRRGEPA